MTMLAEPGPSIPLSRRLGRAALIVVIAAVGGPLIAGLAAALVMVATTSYVLFTDPTVWNDPLMPVGVIDIGSGLVEMLIVIVGTAYMIGGGIAAITGILLAAWSQWRPLSLVVTVLAAVLANLVFFALFEREVFAFESDMPRSIHFATVTLSLFAAVIGWLLARRWVAR